MDLETYSDDEGVVLKRRSVKLTLIDSDDDDDALPGGKTAAATTFVGGGAAESSSEEDDDSGKENSSLKANRVKSKRRVVARDSDSESDGEGLLNFKTQDADDGEGPKKPAATLFKDKDLYDDETSDHEEVGRKKSAAAGRGEESSGEDCSDSEGSNEDFGDLEPGGDEDQEEAKKKTATKPSRKLESRKAKTAAMEGIELIHSETQRLLRESRLSLPYHRPKQHTIAEFLQRRSVRATAQERNANSQDLGLIWKELEERTKEAEAFYKSDTEDSDDDTAGQGGEKQQPSSQDTVAGEPGAPDALKDSGILSTTSSFTGEASSPVECDPTPSEGKGADGSPCPEGPEDPSTNQNSETQRVPDPNCEEDNKAEDPSTEQVDHNSPELFRQQLEVPRDEESKVQETSPDLFLTQTQGTRDSEEKAAAPEVEGEEVCKATPRSAAAILLSRLGNVKPRLSCGEGEVVDLTDDGDSTTTPGRRGGVEELISRFMKHAGSKPVTPKENPQVGVSVVSVEKDADGLEQVKNDTVFVALEEVASAVDPSLSKPGARLKRLKEELNKKIAKQREEEWAKRQLEFKMDEEEIDNEKSVCGLLDDEREAELSESETEEEEEEEDDVPIVEKKRTKSAFLDDEAEVSEDDEDGGALSGGEDEAEEEDGGGGGDDNVDGGDESEEAESDDDDTEEEEDTTPPEDAGKKPKLRRIKTFDMFETDEEKSGDEGEEDVGNQSTVSALNIPPYQPGGAITQPAKEEPGSITPLLKVPVLKGVISEPNLQNLNESSLMSPCDPPTQPAATDGVDVNQAKKKLFNQSEFSTQENMAELMDVCSGTFSGKMMASELMGLCSGNFSTQPVNLENLEKDDEKALAPAPPSYPLDDLEDTQPMGSASDSFSTQPANSAPQLLPGGQSLGDEQRQGLLVGNEDSNAQFPDQTPNTPPGLRLRILSSDEEAEEENTLQKNKKKGKKRKKKNMQLQISDDEDEEDGEASDRSIGYDSEENEIDPEEAVLRRKTKATEFFEDEAELSESEWGSADEDEQDLDKLEWEEGDAEKLNEKKVREQLEKIHMRRVLDDDQREVRILQELLLEDGEFHSDGPGRERKFRWRNINITQVEQEPRGSDDENPEEGEEEENELEWRKKRLERETFFMEQKEKAAAAGKDLDEEDDLLADEGDSQLLQLGKAALKRMRSFNSDQGPRGEKRGVSATDPQVSPNPKYPFRLLTKRGSFLSRSEVALARIAHITRGAGATVLNGPKHSRNFVFAAISPEKVLDPPEERAEDLKTATAAASSKRKSSSTSATLLQKKPRLSTGKGLFDHLEL